MIHYTTLFMLAFCLLKKKHSSIILTVSMKQLFHPALLPHSPEIIKVTESLTATFLSLSCPV